MLIMKRKRETCRPDWIRKHFQLGQLRSSFSLRFGLVALLAHQQMLPVMVADLLLSAVGLTSCGHTTTSADLLPYERPWTLCEGVCHHKLHWHVFDGLS